MKKKKKSRFGLGLICYATIMTVIMAIVFIVFWNLVEDYEESMPSHGMERVVKDFNGGNYDKYFTDASVKYGEFEKLDSAKQYIVDMFKGKEVVFEKAKNYTDKTPVFVLKADNKRFATVTLKKTGKNGFDFDLWGFSKIDFSEYIKTTEYTISAPSGTTVYVNDVPVSESYKTGEKEIERLKEASKYTSNLPKIIEYKVTGLIYQPVVKGTDVKGQAVEAVADGNSYTIGFVTNQALETEQKEYVLKVSATYVKTFINVREGIMKYLMPESDLYKAVGMTDTSWYPVEYMNGYSFKNQEVSNFIYYSEDCFGCDIYYDVKVYFRGWSVTSKIEKCDMNFVFVKKDGTWYLTSTSYN